MPPGRPARGASAVVHAPPDGYSWLFGFDTHAVNPSLIPNLSFDTRKDLAHLTLIGTAPMAIATAPNKPYRRFADVIEAARAKPKGVSYGSVGSGSLGHLMMTLVGRPPASTSSMCPIAGAGRWCRTRWGDIRIAIGSVAVLSPHVRSGKLRAVAITGDRRTRVLPDVPTLAEEGFPRLLCASVVEDVRSGGTPQPILDKVRAEVMKVLESPEVQKPLTESLRMDIVASSPRDLASFLEKEMSRCGEVVRKNGIKQD